MNLQLLAKLLALGASDNDAEAAGAARKANAMLRAAGTTWEALLRPPGQARGDEIDLSATETDVVTQIRLAFDELGLAALYDDSGLRDLYVKFKDVNYLSPAQRRPLFEAVRRKRAGQ